MKKVLIVAYHFPPSNAVGALRPAKFAEYLPEFGWQPIVLAGDEEVEGEPQFAGLDGVSVEVVEAWPGLRDLSRGAARQIRSLRRRNGAKTSGDSGSKEAESAWRTEYLASDTGHNTLRNFLYSLMWLPDDRQGWIVPAVCAGVRLVRTARPSVVLATSPPHSVQVVGLLIALLTGLPLVSDFRDPWIGNPGTPDFIRTGPTRQIHETLEGQVIDRSKAITTTTRSYARLLAGDHPDSAERIRVMPNGFDRSVFQGTSTAPLDPERFTITYAGSFYHTRTPLPLLEAIALLRDQGRQDPGDIRLNFLGDCEFAGADSVREMARRLGLEETLRMPGRVPYREALEHLVRSDLLLLLALGQPIQIPAKAYEYAAAGTPILALVEPGATADFLRDAADADIIFEATPERIAEAVDRRMRCDRRTHGVWQLPEAAAPFDRRTIARDLAGVLDRVCAA